MFWFGVKINAENGFSKLEQIGWQYFLAPKANKMVAPWATKMWALLSWWKLAAMILRTANKAIRWKEHKLEKWLRASHPCQLMWIPNRKRWLSYRARKQLEGGGLHGDYQGEDWGWQMPILDLTWVKKTPKTTNLYVARIQVSVEAFDFNISHFGFVKFCLINSETTTGYTLWWNGETLQEMYIQDRAHWPNANFMLMGTTEWR